MKKRKICIKEKKWNLMWKLWKDGSLYSPLTELLSYENSMQIGGHLRYFKDTTPNEVKEAMMIIKEYLPEEYYNNFLRAYLIYLDMNCRINNGEKLSAIQMENLFYETDHCYYKDEGIMYKVLLDFSIHI